MKHLFIILIILLSSATLNAQTLSAGDIAFVGMNTDAIEGYSFITLVDIPGSEQIFFSDRGIITSSSYNTSTEGTYKFTAPAGGIPCGTIVSFAENSPDVYTISGVTGATMTLEAGFAFLGAGDQVYAYQTPTNTISVIPSDATFIAGIMCDYESVCIDATTKWTQSACVNSTSQSIIPPGLTNGVNAISMTPTGPEIDNMVYVGTLTGTAAAVRASINDFTNWSTNNFPSFNISPTGYPVRSITCAAPCTDPTVPTITFTPSTICTGSSATLTIAGTLNDASAWQVYTGSCGSTLVGTTAGSTITVSPPTGTTTYFVRGEGGCVTPGSCGTVTITTTALDDASFSYSAPSYLTNDTDPTPTITGLSGGTFSSSPGGLSLNASTGSIDISASATGTYTVTYTTVGLCPSSSNVIVTISIAPCSELFFSEYLEGSSSNKAFEIYNPTTTPINLSDYVVYRNNNGSLTPSDSLFPLGIVASGDVFVVGNPSANSGIMAQVDTTHTMCFYNGDDALWLKKISTGDTIDKIGDIGVDPGSGWPVGAGATNNNTLIRMIGVQKGETNWPLGSTQWDVFPIDMDDSLGMHNAIGCASLCTGPTTAICQNINVYLDGAGNASITPADIDDGSSVSCGTLSLNANQTAFTCADLGPNNVTLTASNGLGGSDNCNAIVTVLDTVSPVITCPGNQTEIPNASCLFTLPDYTSLGSATDNCGGSVTVVQFPAVGSFINSNTTITLFALDVNGNSSTCTFEVILSDPVAPSAVCQNITAFLDGSGNVTISGADIDGGSTDNCGAVTLSASQTAFTCADLGANNVTLTVTDGSSNTNSCVAVVTVLDTISPVAVCQNITVFLDGAGNASIVPSDVNNGSSDNCGSITLSLSQTAFTCTNLGANNVTLTANDGNGNTSSCIAIVTVADTISPIAVCQNISVFLDGAGNASMVAADIDGGSSDNCGTVSLSASQTAFTCANLGANNVTLTVNDSNGNTSSCAAIITVHDTISPTVSCQLAFVFLDGAGTAILSGTDLDAGSTDNCGTVTLSTSQTLFTCADLGQNMVTLTADDGNGNSNSCTASVFVIDTITPPITCPANISQNIDAGLCGALVTYTAPVGVGNCPGFLTTQTAGLPSGSVFPVGTTTNTFVVTYVSGTSSTCSFDVVINDNESPTISCLSNITQNNDIGVCGATINYSAPVGIDNCPGSTTAQTAGLPSGSIFPIGTTTNTFTVTDASGSTATCSFDVVISDNELPTITCIADIAQNNDLGVCGATINYIPPVGLDNCPASATVQTGGLPSGSIFPIGTTTNTFEVTDASGNIANCSFDVVVTDSELPTITCQADIAQNNDASVCGATVNYTAPTGTDNCPGSTTAQTAGLTSGSVFPIGTTTNTFEVTDAAGNVANCSFDVVITDNELPTITCITDIAQNNDFGQCNAIVTYTPPIGIDNCPGATTVQTAGLASGNAFPVGATTNTFVVTDASGNTATCSFDVVISDTESPTITCIADIAEDNDLGQCDAIVTYTAPIGLDNCPGALTVQITGLPSGGTFPVGTTTNTFEVTDAAGNSITCSFDVTISDTELPTITCPIDIAQDNDLGICGAIVTYTAPVGADNCPGPITVQTAGLASGDEFPIGTTTNTFEVTDAAGNIATCSFDVVISDAELPTIVCADAFESCDSILTVNDPDISDNCLNPVFELTSGLMSDTIFPVGITTNVYTVTDASGNQATCSVEITRFLLPTIDAGADLVIDAGKNIDISASSTNADLFDWEPIEGLDDPSSENPNADPMYTTTYSILVTSPDGCIASDTLNIKVIPVIEVNNFMSPNDDGKNDTWIIKGHYLLDNCVIQVYSSWGNLVYESNNGYDNKWDGTFRDKDLPAGVYYYIISCESDNPIKGSVTLVR
ncbi:MAG: HYR domain-containing protein [Crocinitomicaceae bacterium]